MSGYFVGIDPGESGGIGVLDSRGRFIAAHRWQPREPVKLFHFLAMLKDTIAAKYVYLELVQTFPQKDKGFIVRNQSLMVNLGIWQGFALAAGLDYELISPLTWQSAHKLQSWAKRQSMGIKCHSPLSLARQLWPLAPLEYQADDGKAVALLLAELSRRDHISGLDRRAAREAREAQAAKRRRQRRQLRQLDPGPIPSPAQKSRQRFPHQSTAPK